MAGAGLALVEMLGLSRAPLLVLAELQRGGMYMPWLARIRNPDSPALSVGLEEVEEEAARIFLEEERETVPGEPGAFRTLQLDEGGFRPGLHALLRPAGSPIGHAVAAATAVALAREAGGTIWDRSRAWMAATGEPAGHLPDDFLAALRSERPYASVIDGAAALWARRPVKRRAPAS
jgi:hypothetical protein